MNAMDILGGILGRKSQSSGGGGLGGAILGSILKGGRSGGPKRSAEPEGRGSAVPGAPKIGRTPGTRKLDSLEDLLRHAHNRHQQRRPQQNPSFPQPEPQIQKRQTEFSAEFDGNPEPFNAQAEILVIAMINAAKADGRIDQAEQDAIVKQLGDLSQDEVQFLQEQFRKPVDVKEFVWSVPLGMERQVYAVSLMAIDLDQNSEAQYLRELGHGFRMDLDECNQVHQEFGAPQMR